jgi:hypothetical protein
MKSLRLISFILCTALFSAYTEDMPPMQSGVNAAGPDVLLSGDCLAANNSTGDCVVDRGFFNSIAAVVRLSADIAQDSAHRFIIEQALMTRYYAAQARTTGYGHLADVALSVRRDAAAQHTSDSSATPTTEELKRVYYSWHDSLFREREDVVLSLIGSTDSTITAKAFALARHGTLMLPWLESDSRDLPGALTHPTDTLPVDSFTEPLATEFGWYIARVTSATTRMEISFEDAYDELLTLYRDQGARPLRPVTEGEAKNYYNHNREKYRRPVRYFIKLWIVPDCAGSTSRKGSQKSACAKLMPGGTLPAKDFRGITDTAFCKGIQTPHCSLPAALWNQLSHAKDLKPGIFLSAQTVYGRAYARVDSIGPENGYHPFDSVKIGIKNYLKTLPDGLQKPEADTATQTAVDFYLARQFRQEIIRRMPPPTDAELTAALSRGEIKNDPDDGSDQIKRNEMLRQQVQQVKAEAPFRIWRAAIQIQMR